MRKGGKNLWSQIKGSTRLGAHRYDFPELELHGREKVWYWRLMPAAVRWASRTADQGASWRSEAWLLRAGKSQGRCEPSASSV